MEAGELIILIYVALAIREMLFNWDLSTGILILRRQPSATAVTQLATAGKLLKIEVLDVTMGPHYRSRISGISRRCG